MAVGGAIAATREASPRLASAPWREIAFGLGCALAGVAFTLFLYALNRRAFFSDDTQNAFAPIFMAIGRALAHGHWPALTLQMLNGGALAGEYQYGLYNPFSLLACFIASLFNDQANAEAVIVGMHYAVLGAGAYAFARNSGASRPLAALAAVTFLTNNFIYYWLAESWITGLVSIAWLTWAMAFLIKAHQSRWAWLGAALATALVVTSGCYHVVVMLGMATVVIAVTRWRLQGAPAAIAPLLAAALGVLLAVAAILPVLAMSAVAVRTGGLNNSGQMAVDLYGVLAPSSPFHTGHIVSFDGLSVLGAPIYFAGWFLLPLLPLIELKRLGRLSPTLIALGAMALLFIVATQGPEQVLSIRFPIWYLAPLHLVLLTAFSVVASKAGFARPTRLRVWAVVLIAYFGWLASLQVLPEERNLALMAAVATCAFAALGTYWNARAAHGYIWAGLLGTVFFVVVTHLAVPTNSNQLDRKAPSTVTAISDLTAIPTTAGVFLGTIDEAPIWRAPEIEVAAMPLIHGVANPFGYSPVGHRAFSYKFWLELWGTPLADATPNLFQVTRMNGLSWADLMRVDEVVVPKVGGRPAKLAALMGPPWRVARTRPYTVTFARVAAPPRGPGSVAWTSPGLKVQAAGPASAERETLKIVARSGKGDQIVFDRLAWPGYGVTFAGRPLALDMFAGPLMTVSLPNGGLTGDLALTYAPPFWRLGLACALVALAALALIVWRWRRLFRPAIN